jgi:hypothetical protein
MTELSFGQGKPTINPLILAQAYVEVLLEKLESHKKAIKQVQDLCEGIQRDTETTYPPFVQEFVQEVVQVLEGVK